MSVATELRAVAAAAAAFQEKHSRPIEMEVLLGPTLSY